MYKLWLEDTSFTLVSELVNRKKKKKVWNKLKGLFGAGGTWVARRLTARNEVTGNFI